MSRRPSRYLTFHAAGRLQALSADIVREVVRLPRMARVPHAPPSLVGLANIRGVALPIFSAAVSQGPDRSKGSRVLVLDRAHPIGLLVDDVRAIVEAKPRNGTLDLDALLGLAFNRMPARAAPAIRTIVKTAKADERVTLDIVSFIVEGQEFALPLDQVLEVIAAPAVVTRLPDADRAVVGTIEHHGELLPILALARLLGLPERASAPLSRIVIARLRGHRIGLAVERTRSVLRVEEACIDPVPTVIARLAGEARIQAIARLEDGRRLVSILAADRLFGDALMAQIADRRDDRTEGGEDMAAQAMEPFLIFRLGAQSFGLPAMAVDEIVRLPETLTRLPRAPAFVEGVMNRRGRAIPVIDQRRRFGEEARLDRHRRAIVVHLGALQAAFVVDEVTEIRRIASTRIAPAPDISDETRLFDRTAMMADGSIVLLIEPSELLDGTERDLLAALNADAAGARP